MRVYLKSVVLTLLLMLAVPMRADAGLAAFLDYLDNLSGPGSFWGAGYEMDLLCNHSSRAITWRCFPFVQDPERVLPRFAAGPRVSWMKGRTNDNLTYPDDTGEDDKHVNVLTYGGHATVLFSETFGATLKLTGYRFSGPLVREGSRTRATVGLGPILRPPVPGLERSRFYIAPLMIVGLGQFAKEDFGIAEPSLLSDNVKFAVQAGFDFF